MTESDSKNIPPWIGDTSPTDIFRQETGNSGRLGGPTAYFRCLCKRDGLRWRGETTGDAVGAGGSREAAEGHGRSNFGSGKGAAEKGIRQAWWERGRVGGGEHG